MADMSFCLTDTHTHLYLEEFAEDRDLVVKRAIDHGVKRMILPNVDLQTVQPMHELASRYPDNMRMAMGLHPSEVDEAWSDKLAVIATQFDEYKDYVAVGEIGMDLYWDRQFVDQQMQALDQQLSMAQTRCLPVIIHCREALPQTLEVMQGHGYVKAVFHCFGGSLTDVESIRRVGDYYFGIGGVATFKNSKLPSVLPAIGIDRILLETDAPYLAPVPNRGKRNESSFLTATMHAVASALNVSDENVARSTSANSVALFGF